MFYNGRHTRFILSMCPFHHGDTQDSVTKRETSPWHLLLPTLAIRPTRTLSVLAERFPYHPYQF